MCWECDGIAPVCAHIGRASTWMWSTYPNPNEISDCELAEVLSATTERNDKQSGDFKNHQQSTANAERSTAVKRKSSPKTGTNEAPQTSHPVLEI